MILLMLSGGLDSTGALVKLLQGPEPVHVHHVILKNIENRWQAERIACRNIVQYCRNHYRPFGYTTNVFEFMAFRDFFGWDNDIIRFIAAQVAKNDPSIHSVALGKCADDSSLAFKLRSVQAHAIWRSSFFDTKWRPPGIIRPVGEMTKKAIADSLPPLLFKLTWSCRTPKLVDNIWSRCEECNTCEEMKDIHEDTSSI